MDAGPSRRGFLCEEIGDDRRLPTLLFLATVGGSVNEYARLRAKDCILTVGDDPPFLGDALLSRGFFDGLPWGFFTPESSSAEALRLPTGVVGNSEETCDFPDDWVSD